MNFPGCSMTRFKFLNYNVAACLRAASQLSPLRGDATKTTLRDFPYTEKAKLEIWATCLPLAQAGNCISS
jgi:hypothetical protein